MQRPKQARDGQRLIPERHITPGMGQAAEAVHGMDVVQERMAELASTSLNEDDADALEEEVDGEEEPAEREQPARKKQRLDVRSMPASSDTHPGTKRKAKSAVNPLLCSTTRFHCKNGRCMDKSFLCDGQNNCRDNSDEENCDNPQEGGSGQDYVTSQNQLLYYPSITYAIIGSSVIFVLVVALLALVLHHQRKRNNLMTLPVHRLQHPVLLSRLVVLDHPHNCSVTYNVDNGVQYMSGQGYQMPPGSESPPSYSEAFLDQSRPPWYDLPPPPYSSDKESALQAGLPPYRSRTSSSTSLEADGTGNSDCARMSSTCVITDNPRTPQEETPDPSESLLNPIMEREA